MSKSSVFDKVIKKFLILLALLVVSPIVISMAFKALKIYSKSPQIYIGYTLLGIGTFLLLFTVYFGFKTIKAFLDNLFEK